MCDPVTATALTGGSAAMNAYGQYQAGIAERNAARYSADQDEATAKAIDRQVLDAGDRGELERERIRIAGAREMGAGRSAFAGGNIDLSVGTPVFWQLDSAENTARDVSTSKLNTANEQLGLRTQAWDIRNRATLKRFSGEQAARAANFGAVSTLLGAAGQTAFRFGGK